MLLQGCSIAVNDGIWAVFASREFPGEETPSINASQHSGPQKSCNLLPTMIYVGPEQEAAHS